MANVTMKLAARPTSLTKFLYRYWVIGVLTYPVWRFFPARWLVEVDAE